ncbi:MAG TPA: response regulator transcription factor [Sphingobacteriaceae bacterium]|nr:response regulator transcription factor [Sphingobacteriaceae bacterium]
MSNGQLKILVAIDHNLFADGLSRLLNDVDGVTVCKVVNCGNQLVDEYSTEQPDVALVDLNMPNLNGIQAARKIMRDFPNAKIIILSLYVNTSLIRQLKNSGIQGYLESSCNLENLVSTIKNVSDGSHMYNSIEHNKIELDWDQDEIHLTTREIQILKLIAEGFTAAEIAKQIFISAQTVNSHRKKLIEKLEVRNSVELVSKALRQGLIIWSGIFLTLLGTSNTFI